MMFKPAPGMVLVKPLEEAAIMASTNKNYDRMAEVIAIPIANEDSFAEWHGNLRVGDIICFDEYAYRSFDYEGREYCVVNVSEPGALWGIIKQNASTETSTVSSSGLPAPISPVSST